MAFGALGGALKSVGKGLMNAPGMGAIRKPLAKGMQATPGLKGVGKSIGLGPTNPPQAAMGGGMGARIQDARNQVQPQQPMNLPMQNAVQNAGGAVSRMFGMNRPRPEPMPMQAPPMMAPEQQMQEPDPQAIQAMQNMKQQQMAMMGQNVGQAMGGMLGGGMGMARPQPFQRNMQMGQQPEMMGGGPMPMPDESFDAQRRNKFMQMRQGIGPRMGMMQNMMQRPMPQEPEMY